MNVAREGLPIIGMEQDIMEAVRQHDILVLQGETGCGKTTQVRIVLRISKVSVDNVCHV